jgi:hypothetical protein
LLAGGSLSLALVVASLFWRRRREALHPGLEAFKRFAASAERQGIVRPSHESPSAFVRRMAIERGLANAQTDALVELLESVLYNPAADQSANSVRLLKRGLRRFAMASAFRSTI